MLGRCRGWRAVPVVPSIFAYLYARNRAKAKREFSRLRVLANLADRDRGPGSRSAAPADQSPGERP
jgi:hypothetical protein